MRTLMSLLFASAALAATPAAADEAKTAITAPMIMNLLAQPMEAREAAYDDSLRARDTAGEAAPSAIGEILDDGTVRYGRTTITVKNPCPPGTLHYEPPPLPGRRK
ncbi:MAG: hypothetical protein HYR51_10910 [Candidatus Rokubacteria bacterium]|nr:hypothetical protein [Candidatus Rokubacteria bacterium]